MRVGILTGGGDCPGLNAVIRAAVRKGTRVHGDEVIGFLDGYRGVVDQRTMPLDVESLRGKLPIGGTILGTRSEEHTSELQSLMRISSAVFCLKKNKHLVNLLLLKNTYE